MNGEHVKQNGGKRPEIKCFVSREGSAPLNTKQIFMRVFGEFWFTRSPNVHQGKKWTGFGSEKQQDQAQRPCLPLFWCVFMNIYEGYRRAMANFALQGRGNGGNSEAKIFWFTNVHLLGSMFTDGSRMEGKGSEAKKGDLHHCSRRFTGGL